MSTKELVGLGNKSLSIPLITSPSDTSVSPHPLYMSQNQEKRPFKRKNPSPFKHNNDNIELDPMGSRNNTRRSFLQAVNLDPNSSFNENDEHLVSLLEDILNPNTRNVMDVNAVSVMEDELMLDDSDFDDKKVNVQKRRKQNELSDITTRLDIYQKFLVNKYSESFESTLHEIFKLIMRYTDSEVKKKSSPNLFEQHETSDESVSEETLSIAKDLRSCDIHDIENYINNISPNLIPSLPDEISNNYKKNVFLKIMVDVYIKDLERSDVIKNFKMYHIPSQIVLDNDITKAFKSPKNEKKIDDEKENIGGKQINNPNLKKNMRGWLEGFILKQEGKMTGKQIYEQVFKSMDDSKQSSKHLLKHIPLAEASVYIKCEGCSRKMEGLNNDTSLYSLYKCGSVPNKVFVFHDYYCINLRKYLEAIRQYVLVTEIRAAGLKDYKLPTDDCERILKMFRVKDSNIVTNIDEITRPLEDILGNLNDPDSRIYRRRKIATILLYQQEEDKIFLKLGKDSLSQHKALATIPLILQHSDVYAYGQSLWQFCLAQLQAKDRTSIWDILRFLAWNIPTPLAIRFLESYQESISKLSNMDNLDMVCQAMVETSDFPIATSLYLSAFLLERSKNDLSREEEFLNMSDKYIQIASKLLAQIESDHLLAIILEVPSDIDEMSIVDIALRYNLEDFLNFHRLTPVIYQLWYKHDFLNPKNPFLQVDWDYDTILEHVAKHPIRFYYSPYGLYIIASILYVIYVLLLSYVTYELKYPFDKMRPLELLLWVSNFGFVSYEVIQFFLQKRLYLADAMNYWDIFISINWVIMFIMRFVLTDTNYFPPTFLSLNDGKYEKSDTSKCATHFVQDFNAQFNDTTIAEKYPDFKLTDSCSRNLPFNITYIVFWCIQCVLLWTRVAGLFQRSPSMGPLIRMIVGMMKDIFSFSLILVVFIMGFIFALYYTIGRDLVYADEVNLGSFKSISFYMFLVLLGEQDWPKVESNDEFNFAPSRSRIAEGLCLLFSVLGTILLLNLLIALMASTYERFREKVKKEVNFNTIRHTIESASQNAIIPPPFNIFVFGLFFLVFLFDKLIMLLYCGKKAIYIPSLFPLQYSLLKDLEIKDIQDQYNPNQDVPRAKSRGTFYQPSVNPQYKPFENDLDDVSELIVDVKKNKRGNLARVNSAQRKLTINEVMNDEYNKVNDKCCCFELETLNPRWEYCFDSFISFFKCSCWNNCGCCQSEEENKDKLDAALYCRYCRNRTDLKNGTIDLYFSLYSYYGVLDDADMNRLRSLTKNKSLCKHCFRPIKFQQKIHESNRLFRFQVILEMLSFPVFMIFLYVPLLLVLSIPAFLTKFWVFANNLSVPNANTIDELIQNDPNIRQMDIEYRSNVRGVIHEVVNENGEDDNNNNNNSNEGQPEPGSNNNNVNNIYNMENPIQSTIVTQSNESLNDPVTRKDFIKFQQQILQKLDTMTNQFTRDRNVSTINDDNLNTLISDINVEDGFNE